MRRYRVLAPGGEATLVHYGAAMDALRAQVDLDLAWKDADAVHGADLCILAGECAVDHALVASAAVRADVPCLLMMDGALEWRNTFDHYNDAREGLATPLLQPVLAHKVACAGQRQAEWIEDFGNPGRCEITGLPRLDDLLALSAAETDRVEGPKRLLVASANRPAYDESQWKVVEQAFSELRALLLQECVPQGVEIVWRVAPPIASLLGITQEDGHELREVLRTVDAVITTPSTLVLEAMLFDLPVAVLDYFDTPAYLAAAWNVRCSAHIRPVLDGLIRPSPVRMLHQRLELARHYRLDGPAAPRVTALMESMIDAGRRARKNREPLRFSSTTLERTVLAGALAPITERFPNMRFDQERDRGRLLVEIQHLREALRGQDEECEQRVSETRARAILGEGSLLSRMLHCFPQPRRMLRSYLRWRAERGHRSRD